MVRRAARFALGLALAAILGGCPAPKPAAVPSLEFTRYRVNVDDKHAVARVVGEVVNHGEQRLREIEVHATLVGGGGTERGENMVPLKNLLPGEARTFALNVTTHGTVTGVRLRWELPGKSG